MQLNFGNNLTTVSGTIGILGTGAIFHSNTPYMAVLTGTFLGSVIGAAPIAPELTGEAPATTRPNAAPNWRMW